MNKPGREEIQEVSEIPIFNLIGNYAETKGYYPVYFKVLMPKLTSVFKFENKQVHYIHLLKDGKMKCSIYYDEFNVLSIYPDVPYYELYDNCDIERFLKTDEDEVELYDRVKEII